MALVLMATMPWGQLWDKLGNAQVGETVVLKERGGATLITHYLDDTGADPSTVGIPSDERGRLMRFVEEGSYDLLDRGETLPVEAVAGATTAAVAVIKEAPVNVDDPRFAGSISAAIAHGVTAAKGAVYIPSAARSIAATIAVSAGASTGLEIFGDGMDSSVLTMAGTASLIGFDVANAADRVTIRDLYIKGSTAQGTGPESHAIRFQESSNYGKVYRVRIDGPGDDGIHFAGCVAPKAEDCFITNTGGNGIHVGKDATAATNAAAIRDNWVQSCTGNGIYVDRCELVGLYANRLETNGTDSAGTGNLYLFESLYPVVQGNYFEDGADFELRYNDSAGFAVDGSIIDNIFQASSAPNAAPITVWLENCFRAEMARNKFSSVLSAVVNLQCGSGTNGLVLRRHHFQGTVSFAATTNTSTGIVEPCNVTFPTVASAATVTLPGYAYVEITGTTNITTLTAGRAGRIVTLKFTDAAPGKLIDGSNLKLNGDFAPLTGDTITLTSDGSNWNE